MNCGDSSLPEVKRRTKNTKKRNCVQIDEMMDTLDLDRDGNVNMDDFMRIFIDLNKKEESRKNTAKTKCNIL